MKLQRCWAAVYLLLASSAFCLAETRIYSFDDGTFQGWNYTDADVTHS